MDRLKSYLDIPAARTWLICVQGSFGCETKNTPESDKIELWPSYLEQYEYQHRRHRRQQMEEDQQDGGDPDELVQGAAALSHRHKHVYTGFPQTRIFTLCLQTTIR